MWEDCTFWSLMFGWRHRTNSGQWVMNRSDMSPHSYWSFNLWSQSLQSSLLASDGNSSLQNGGCSNHEEQSLCGWWSPRLLYYLSLQHSLVYASGHSFSFIYTLVEMCPRLLLSIPKELEILKWGFFQTRSSNMAWKSCHSKCCT